MADWVELLLGIWLIGQIGGATIGIVTAGVLFIRRRWIRRGA